jgi:signal transduction histidine kinase
MLAEMQLTVQKERTVEEYKASVNHIMSDTQKLIRLSNSLLDLAKANFDQTEIAFKEIRLDEILLDASNDLLHNQPNYKVNIAFESEIENDNFISIKGNEYLLKVAFINLIENGCKFSINKQCKVAIAYTDRDTVLVFSDNGIGISSEELNNIYKPFYRGANKKFADGNGIGLFLTKKIISLHGGDISVFSRENEGTAFTIKIPHI